MLNLVAVSSLVKSSVSSAADDAEAFFAGSVGVEPDDVALKYIEGRTRTDELSEPIERLGLPMPAYHGRGKAQHKCAVIMSPAAAFPAQDRTYTS